VAIEYKLYNIIGGIKVCMDFKMLKVKVPIIFSGTQGFPARGMDLKSHFAFSHLRVSDFWGLTSFGTWNTKIFQETMFSNTHNLMHNNKVIIYRGEAKVTFDLSFIRFNLVLDWILNI
jgi:hypothetical protein